MKPLSHHVGVLKAQPHHIRKRAAFGIALGVSSVIGVLWLGLSLASGTFALKDTSSFATAEGASATLAATSPTASSNLAAAAAADTAIAPSAPAHIEIVDAKPAPAAAAEPTSIPF